MKTWVKILVVLTAMGCSGAGDYFTYYADTFGPKTSATLSSVITKVGSKNCDIVLSGKWVIDTTVTVPASVRIVVPRESIIEYRNGATLVEAIPAIGEREFVRGVDVGQTKFVFAGASKTLQSYLNDDAPGLLNDGCKVVKSNTVGRTTLYLSEPTGLTVLMEIRR